MSVAIPNVICEFSVTNDNYIQVTLDSTTCSTIGIQFNGSLMNIMPFELDSEGEIHFTTLNTVMVENTECTSAFAQIYSTVFPFVDLVFTSDTIPIQNTQFLTSGSTVGPQQEVFNRVILKYKIATNTPTIFKNYWEYVNTNPLSKYYNFYLDSPLSNTLTIKCFLRTRDNVLVPYPVAKNSIFIMDLQIFKPEN